MYDDAPRKYRDDDTWAMVRRAWEAGETARSCARRFDVGMDNLWRRRAKENWCRIRPQAATPEPTVGWERHAAQALDAFEVRRDETRMLAEALAAAMAGGPMERIPLWHVGWVLRWRAERLGAEAAAADRAWALGRAAWLADFWDEAGRFRPLAALDQTTLRANREAWREEAGLPPGVAESYPAGA